MERFDKVLDALSGRVAVTMRNRLVDEDQRIGFTVRRDSASGDVTAEVFVDPGVRHGDRSLTNVRLAELHGEAYVDLGRALGATDPGRAADWSKVYGAVASTGEDGRGGHGQRGLVRGEHPAAGCAGRGAGARRGVA